MKIPKVSPLNVLLYTYLIHCFISHTYVYVIYNIKLCLQRPPTTSPCTTLPITGYYIHAIVTNSNGDANERIYTSNRIDDTMGDGMGRFSVSYNDSFDQELEPNANYAFVVNTQNNIIEIPRTGTCPSCGK